MKILLTQKHLSINIAYYLQWTQGEGGGGNVLVCLCQQTSNVNNLKVITFYVLRCLLLFTQ